MYKNYIEYLNESKKDEYLEIPQRIQSMIDVFSRYLSDKLGYQVINNREYEKFNQGDVSKMDMYGIRFISKKIDMFRLNWESPGSGFSDISSVDFWFSDDNIPSIKVYVEGMGVVSLVSLVLEFIRSNYENDSFDVERYILGTIDIEDDENVLTESMKDSETDEYNKLRNKYKKEGAESLESKERERLIYLQAVRLGYRSVVDAMFKTDVVKEETIVPSTKDERIERMIERLNRNEEDYKVLFDDMEKLMTSVVLGHSNSLIITGTAGIGKTTSLENVMDRFKYEMDVDYRLVKGASTAYGAYREFFMYRDDKLIVFDDCDDLFDNSTAINVLKGVLDTKKNRTVSWVSNSTFSKMGKSEEEIEKLLKKGRIPNTFSFTSGIIFITNISREKIMDDPDLQALISRSNMIDITLDDDQLIDRITHIINKIDLGISKEEKDKIFDVMMKAYESGVLKGKIDIRTFIKMAQIKKTAAYFEDGGLTDEQWVRLAIRYS